MKKIFLIFILLVAYGFATKNQKSKSGYHTYVTGFYDGKVKGGLDNHEGYKSYEANDFAGAFTHFKKSCDEGNLKGCINLGFLYDQGKGVGQDKAKAISLYKKPCDNNLYKACSNISSIYRSQKKYKKALIYQKKACSGKVLLDCFSMALFYENGLGVKKNYKMAMKYYQRACNNNYTCINQGISTEQTYKTNEDLHKGYKKACESGKFVNCYTLGVLYQNKVFKAKDFKDGAKLYKKACDEGGFGVACTKYALLYADKQYFPQNDKKAKEYFEKGCDLECSHGCMLGVSSKDEVKFLEGFKKACKFGNQEACNAILSRINK